MFHLAILKPKYYNMILNGTKPIESRFSFNKIAPYKKVCVGDVIYLKQTGKPVGAKCRVERAEFFELTPNVVEEIRVKYGKLIGTDKVEDWQSTKNKKFGTLIWVKDVQKIDSIEVPRSNGSAWFMLKTDLK